MKILDTNMILRQFSDQMFGTRLALNLTLLLTIVLTVNSIRDPNAPKSKTIDKDICHIVPNGLIDTGFVRSYTDPKGIPENYIFFGKYFWRLTFNLTLEDRIYTEISDYWNSLTIENLNMSFAIELNTLRPESSKWYRYEDKPFWYDSYESDEIKIPEIASSSVAFWVFPESYPYDIWAVVLFISQHRINESLVQRKYTFVSYAEQDNPEVKIPDRADRTVPDFILQIDSKYWIKAVLEIKKKVGIIFLEYNNTGLHCYFNKTVNSCVNNKEIIANTKLFGCRDPEPIPEFHIKELTSTQEMKPVSNNLIDFLFGTVYKAVVITLVIIILVLFVILPIIQTFKK